MEDENTEITNESKEENNITPTQDQAVNHSTTGGERAPVADQITNINNGEDRRNIIAPIRNNNGRIKGGWGCAILLLGNQGLATLAFFGVAVNLVLFLTRVMEQGNAEAANNVSKWTGTVYMCSLIGAFLSDSYWGRYLTCAVFQLIFVMVYYIFSIH